jgi:hypothetical protein
MIGTLQCLEIVILPPSESGVTLLFNITEHPTSTSG